MKLLKEQGVAMMTLTWNGPNELGCGTSKNEGLTDFGKAAIKEMEKVGNLELVVLPVDLTESLAKRVSRTWQCLIQDNVMSLIGETASYELDFGSCTRLGAGL